MKRTLYFALIVAAVVIGYDLWTLIRHGYDTTISNVALVFVKEYPIIGVALGVVVGHIYWSNKAREKKLTAALKEIKAMASIPREEWEAERHKTRLVHVLDTIVITASEALEPAKMEQV